MNSEEVGCGGSVFIGSPLQDKSKEFALEIIRVCNEVKQGKRESVLTNQLIRSESEYWLELLIESGYWNDAAILEQCREVKRILISSLNTAKKNGS